MEPNSRAVKAESSRELDETRSRQLTGRQVRAIRLAAVIGDDIRKNYPGIAEEYRGGLTAPKLVAMHELDQRYGVSPQMAVDAVRNAIRGYSGHFYDLYQGLVADKSERENLALAHNRQTGMEEYERRIGIHALTQEQKADAGRKGGLIRGPLSYQLRIGCHALPPEVLLEHCRRIAPLGGKAGGVASVLAQGMVPYKPAAPGQVAEIEYAFSLATDPRYLGPVRANFRNIAQKVNEMFHAGNACYTRTTLKIALQRHRRRACSATEFIPDPEIAFADALVRDPAYQLPARMKGEEIARMVNEEYHGGQSVRNALSIRVAVHRYRRQNAGPGAD